MLRQNGKDEEEEGEEDEEEEEVQDEEEDKAGKGCFFPVPPARSQREN